MSRRHAAEKREVLPDAKYGDRVLTKFMNNLMVDGKKSVAERIVYNALDRVESRLKRSPVECFHEALDNVIRHKILPKMAFDTARPAGNGRARREILVELRDELSKRFEGTNVQMDASSVAELDRMIRLAEGNNGIVNYWLR